MNYTGNTKIAIACSFLENDKNGSATAMKILLDDYKKLLAENAQLKQENARLKIALEENEDNSIFNYFLPRERNK